MRSTGRKGVEAVLDYLDGVGFYTAPSSIDRHHNWRGGLAQHSLETCRLALAGRGRATRESVIIAALLHDICKASRLYYGADGRIHHRSTRIKGHGYRSVALLEREGLELTGEEWLAIRWHMGTGKADADVARAVSEPPTEENVAETTPSTSKMLNTAGIPSRVATKAKILSGRISEISFAPR